MRSIQDQTFDKLHLSTRSFKKAYDSDSDKCSNEIFPDFLLSRTRPTPVFQRLARAMQGKNIGLFFFEHLSISADLPALVAIWRRSVQATHGFLREQDFQEIETSVSEKYFPNTDVWVAVDEYDRPIGFMGLSQAHIDTLFIEPELLGKGIGTMLIAHAEHVSGSLTVDVNEQNQQAVGFYKRMGFIETGRSAADDEGRPYPLLHLSKS